MKTFIFKFKGKLFKIKAKECKTLFSKMLGLMFKKNSPSLLFYFSEEKSEPIHSFFCVPFVAVWFKKNKLVDIRLIKKWKAIILPESPFDKLLEIPINDFNFKEISRRI